MKLVINPEHEEFFCAGHIYVSNPECGEIEDAVYSFLPAATQQSLGDFGACDFEYAGTDEENIDNICVDLTIEVENRELWVPMCAIGKILTVLGEQLFEVTHIEYDGTVYRKSISSTL